MLKTPYYLLDLQKLEKNLFGLRSAITTLWSNFTVGYSFKTNNLPWIASWMRAQCVMEEVVSTPEYELAKYVGYEDSRVILNCPYKGFETMDKVLKAGGIVNLDSFQEINHIKANIQNYGSRIKVGLRINFDL